MRKSQLEEETVKPSTSWIQAGSGQTGVVYFEIIKCDHVPNMDTGTAGKTDAFCCIVYEDAICNTDVINDELSPRWMPWCQRAFQFRMHHPSSQILIGVFDYDAETNVMNGHDPIGRVSMDITNFRPNTDYMLTYDLHSSVLGDDRPPVGTLTVRLRIKYDNYRNVCLASLQLPHLNWINSNKKQDFNTIYFVSNGEENPQLFSMETIQNYRSELENDYLDIPYHVIQAATTVILWRGHYEVKVGGYKLKLPLHSVIAFLMGVYLIDNFNYLPSFTLFSVAWFLLATNEHRQQNPSPWHGTMTFLQMWYAVVAGKPPPVEIADHENEAAIRRYEATIQERKEKEKAAAQEAKETAEKLLQLAAANEEAGATEAIETKVGGAITLNPLATTLLPYQTKLGLVCKSLRIVSSMVLWDESIYAFLITNACLALGIALIWVPWGFVIRWTLRIIIWVTLGPWMKLVDIFYVQKLAEEGDNDAKKFQKVARSRLNELNTTMQALMMKREEMTKQVAMKRYMFGNYVTRIPQFKEYRFPDIPTAVSTATPRPIESSTATNKVNIVETKHGQMLVGHMIPTWGDAKDYKKKD
jgi:hypothetical protein